MNEQKEKRQPRAKLLENIPEILGMNITKFFGVIAGYLGEADGGVTTDALFKVKKREAMSYSYDNFCVALKKGMADYLGQVYPKGSKQAQAQETVRQKWETERGFIQLLIEAAYLIPSEELPCVIQIRTEYEPQKKRLVAAFGTRFMSLTPKTAARLERNFEAFSNITIDDCFFVAAMLTLKGEARAEFGKRLSSMNCPVGNILEQLAPEELVCWKAIRDKVDSGNGLLLTGESWYHFREKVLALPLENAVMTCLLLEYSLPRPDGTEPLGPEEINLFLMFKYCLTARGKNEILDEMKSRHRKAAGDP